MGITFDNDRHLFAFDFSRDGHSDIIRLTGNSYQVYET